MRACLRGYRAWIVGAFVVGTLAISAVAVALTVTPTPVARVNVADDGGLAVGYSDAIAVSADGRYVAFGSSAKNIVPGKTTNWHEIFRRDMQSGETTLVSVSMDGTYTVQGATNDLDMTPDGRYVVFVSAAEGLVPGELNGVWNVFRRDMVSGETTLVSSSSTGVRGGGGGPSISDDGRFVAFYTESSSMFSGDVNSRQDCVLKDLVTGTAINVSYTHDGSLGNGHSFYPTISGNGRVIAFVSYATNMLPDEVSNRCTLFVRDLDAGTLKRVDEKLAGGESAGEAEIAPCAMDYSGRYIAFGSRGKDLVADPVGPSQQVYLRDTVSNETTCVPVAFDGGPAELHTFWPDITADGRYVTFATRSANIVEGDANAVDDIFRRDMQTGIIDMLTFNENGEQLDMYTVENAISASGTAVVFNSRAENILPPYSGTFTHIYRRMLEAADPEPMTTTVTLASGSKTLAKYGDSHVVTGKLESSGAPVPGVQVVLQTSATTSGFANSSVVATTSTEGTFSFKVTPRNRTYYRVTFAGEEGHYEASTSATYVRVTPRALVGVPRAPTTMSRSKYYTVYGYLKPRHTSGTYPVRIYKYRYVSGKWKSYGYVKAKASNYSSYTKYKRSMRLPYAGKWRVRAYHPADSGHPAQWSSKYDYVTVK